MFEITIRKDGETINQFTVSNDAEIHSFMSRKITTVKGDFLTPDLLPSSIIYRVIICKEDKKLTQNHTDDVDDFLEQLIKKYTK